MRKCVTSTEKLQKSPSKPSQLSLTPEILEIADKIQEALEKKRKMVTETDVLFDHDCTEPKIVEVSLKIEYVHKNGSRVMGDPVDVVCTLFDTVKF